VRLIRTIHGRDRCSCSHGQAGISVHANEAVARNKQRERRSRPPLSDGRRSLGASLAFGGALLPRTTTSSHAGGPGAIATRDSTSRRGIARVIACASEQQCWTPARSRRRPAPIRAKAQARFRTRSQVGVLLPMQRANASNGVWPPPLVRSRRSYFAGRAIASKRRTLQPASRAASGSRAATSSSRPDGPRVIAGPDRPPAAAGAAAGGLRDHRGRSTRLITWMTPLDAPTSAAVTRARLT
jgi:hypothetical protein